MRRQRMLLPMTISRSQLKATQTQQSRWWPTVSTGRSKGWCLSRAAAPKLLNPTGSHDWIRSLSTFSVLCLVICCGSLLVKVVAFEHEESGFAPQLRRLVEALTASWDKIIGNFSSSRFLLDLKIHLFVYSKAIMLAQRAQPDTNFVGVLDLEGFYLHAFLGFYTGTFSFWGVWTRNPPKYFNVLDIHRRLYKFFGTDYIIY